MEELVRDLHSWVEYKRYQKIFTEWKLRKGAKNRHMTLYRQYTDMAYGSNGRLGKTSILNTFPHKGRASKQ